MRNLFVVILVLFATQSFATTITVFSKSNGQCRYIISDDNAKPVATWTGDCLENFSDSKKIEIKKSSALWTELKKVNPGLNLKNIEINFINDKTAIAKLNALSIPVIKVDKNAMAISTSQDYNSSRSNKANSISTSQDYNSSRSNKANSIFEIPGDGNNTTKTQPNSISTSQDYNSSRSNKANSISENPLHEGKGNSGTNPMFEGSKGLKPGDGNDTSKTNQPNSISTSQDYNSSRSNKANSISKNPLHEVKGNSGTNPMFEGSKGLKPGDGNDTSKTNQPNSISTSQDYNSSRSNKANSISENPLHEGKGNSGTNPMFEGKNGLKTGDGNDTSKTNQPNSISTSQDYNSSRSNKANSISTSQDYNSSRSNKSGFTFSAGITIPGNNDYMENGFAINTGYHISIKKIFGIELGIGLWSNEFTYAPSPLFPKEYAEAIRRPGKSKLRNITLSVGPSVTLGGDKLNATIYTKAALLFTKIPDEKIGRDYSVAEFGENQISFAFNPGVRFSYLTNSKLSLFLNPELITTFDKNITFKEKDISKAVDKDGSFNQEKYYSLPMEKKTMGINLFGVSVGVGMRL